MSQLLVDGRRLDGRSLQEFRPALLNAGTHSKAKGSAYAEFGSTKVLVGVYGPRETDRRQGFSQSGLLQVDVKRISFGKSSKIPDRQAQSEQEREDAHVVQQALGSVVQLHAFPKSVVDIFCVVLESGGADLSVLITAASLALADAGIPMLDLVSSCYISRVSGQLLLDPSTSEIDKEDAGCLVAIMAQQNQVTQFRVTGEWSMSQLTAVMELGIGACMQLDATNRSLVKSCIPAATASSPDSVVQRLVGDYERAEFPARHNIIFSKALKEFTKTAVLAYECGYTEDFLREEVGSILGGQQSSIDQEAIDKCLLVIALVWITLSLPPLRSRRWATADAVSEATHQKWKGFVCLIMKGYFEKRWAAYPIGRLQMEVSLMTGQMMRPNVIAEMSRIVYSTLECVAPQWPSK